MVARAAATALFLLVLCCSPALAADRDRDRMPDSWEKRYKLAKPRADKDRDGLRNRDEYRARTNPRRRDSDRDGLRDGAELRFGWHPLRRDTDRDGIRDGKENAGVVRAVAGLRVTIELARGGTLTGELDDPQSLTCVTRPAPGAAPAGPEKEGATDWLPEGTETGDPADDHFEWDPAWGEQPEDLDADLDEDAPPLARAAQAGEEDEVAEEEAAAEEEDAAAEAAEGATGPDCQAALKVGALVHEATSELGRNGRRLTRLRLVA